METDTDTDGEALSLEDSELLRVTLGESEAVTDELGLAEADVLSERDSLAL